MYNPPPELADFALLQTFPQYRLEQLDELPAQTVLRFLTIIEERSAQQKREMEKLRG